MEARQLLPGVAYGHLLGIHTGPRAPQMFWTLGPSHHTCVWFPEATVSPQADQSKVQAAGLPGMPALR